MGKTNILTVLTVTVLQIIVGYLWYSSYFFGDVMSVGGHGVDFLKTDVLSLLLVILSSFGLTSIFGMLIKTIGVKDVGGGLKLGLTVGTFAIGLPVVTLLNYMGFGKIMLLVVLIHMILVGVITSLVVLKLKKA
ncbi:MAG: hypothetical protein KGI37_10310 [Alphaproteobacteria bacterium]|nr:hypothetical protein [Alphaproteobacteria bacterium]